MKIKLSCLCIAAIVISSCAPSALPTSVNPQASPVAAIIPTQEILPSPPDSALTFVEPDPETYVTLLPSVLEYFYYRKKAMISGDVEDLWTRFPELRNGVDNPKGINAEGFLISNYQGLKLFDGNISPEAYDRIKVDVKVDEIEVLVHGMELYLFLDQNGQFSESGGEIKIVLYLRTKDNRWDIFKTDEVVQSEWHQFSP